MEETGGSVTHSHGETTEDSGTDISAASGIHTHGGCDTSTEDEHSHTIDSTAPTISEESNISEFIECVVCEKP